MIEEKKEKDENKINLPPLPDDAIEFEGLSLESMVDKNINGNKESANEAETAASNPTLEEFVSEEKITDNADYSELAIAEQDLNYEDPVIINDPTPTEALIEKEFNPSSTQNALDDFNEEGGIHKAVVNGPTSQSEEIIKTKQVDLGNKSSNFNPGTIQNALLNNDIEGGIVTNKSTGSMKTENGDSSKDGKQIKETDKNIEDKKFRVYGFSIQYKSINSSQEEITVTESVSDYYNSTEQAKVSVNGSKYLKPLKSGAFDVVDIISGIPNISFQDQNLYSYKGGKIGMGGYWERS